MFTPEDVRSALQIFFDHLAKLEAERLGKKIVAIGPDTDPSPDWIKDARED